MNRRDLLKLVERRIGGRQLVYVGTRGDDAEALGDVPQLAAVYSVVASLQSRSSVASVALEDLTGERVDLDTSDIDADLTDPHVTEFRRAIMHGLARDSVIVTYRPSAFLGAICFAVRSRCEYAGMFHAHQSAFEHKPWVETSVAALGVNTVPWRYVADEHQLGVLEILEDGPVVLRRSRSSGGTGIVQVDSAAGLRVPWEVGSDGFLSAAPFLHGVPTNVSGVVWHDGVTLHCPSVQVVGIDRLTSHAFGYCGNDFDAARDLARPAVQSMENASLTVGHWLRRHGYLGAFGIDFIVDGSRTWFVELNPRLQGVTHLACQWAASTDRSCVILEHLAASLGLHAPPSEPLEAQLAEMAGLSHLVFHQLAGEPEVEHDQVVRTLSAHPDVARVDVVPRPGVTLLDGATFARASLKVRATDDGVSLRPSVDAIVLEALTGVPEPFQRPRRAHSEVGQSARGRASQ
jgi:hypothetical protein